MKVYYIGYINFRQSQFINYSRACHHRDTMYILYKNNPSRVSGLYSFKVKCVLWYCLIVLLCKIMENNRKRVSTLGVAMSRNSKVTQSTEPLFIKLEKIHVWSSLMTHLETSFISVFKERFFFFHQLVKLASKTKTVA